MKHRIQLFLIVVTTLMPALIFTYSVALGQKTVLAIVEQVATATQRALDLSQFSGVWRDDEVLCKSRPGNPCPEFSTREDIDALVTQVVAQRRQEQVTAIHRPYFATPTFLATITYTPSRLPTLTPTSTITATATDFPTATPTYEIPSSTPEPTATEWSPTEVLGTWDLYINPSAQNYVCFKSDVTPEAEFVLYASGFTSLQDCLNSKPDPTEEVKTEETP